MRDDNLMLSFFILTIIAMGFCTSILISENQKIIDNQNIIYKIVKDK